MFFMCVEISLTSDRMEFIGEQKRKRTLFRFEAGRKRRLFYGADYRSLYSPDSRLRGR